MRRVSPQGALVPNGAGAPMESVAAVFQGSMMVRLPVTHNR